MFREWFDVEYCSMVWDIGNEPFMVDEWVDDDMDDEVGDVDHSTLH
jgi:hypothetical protein